MSLDVTADAGFLCDKPVALEEEIEATPCIKTPCITSISLPLSSRPENKM